MDIYDRRLGPLCGDARKTWIAYRTGPWYGNPKEAMCTFFIDGGFDVRTGRHGYLDATELYLPLEYCL